MGFSSCYPSPPSCGGGSWSRSTKSSHHTKSKSKHSKHGSKHGSRH